MAWQLLILFFVVLISGCSTPRKPEGGPSQSQVVEKPQGVYHKVSRHESLWRISKTYEVTLDDIVRANSIPNAALIEENQLLFIPGAMEVKKVAIAKLDEKPDDFAWPLQGRVSSYFNDARGRHVNRGIDIAAPEGTEVLAARSGKVVFADLLNGYGYTVMLDHLDGFFSVYSYQADVQVKSGEIVQKGAVLGRLARYGRNAFLHFEIRKFEVPNNPLHYLP